MLGLGLAALFAMSAMALGGASSALAKKSPWRIMEECPIGSTVETPGGPSSIHFCLFGEAGPESFFQAGKVTVHFTKPIDLRGGMAVVPSTETYSPTSNEQYVYIPARNGEDISKEAEPGPSLTEGLVAEKLTEPEKQRYEKYSAAGKSTKTTETIEMAAPLHFMSLTNFFGEHGPTFQFDVMIHIQNPFLGKACYDGSTVSPIEVAFTSGETSPPPPNTPISGGINEEHEPEPALVNAEAKLVNNEYAAPGVTGCGVNGGADAAIDAGLGLPSAAGNNSSELIGLLWLGYLGPSEEHIHL